MRCRRLGEVLTAGRVQRCSRKGVREGMLSTLAVACGLGGSFVVHRNGDQRVSLACLGRCLAESYCRGARAKPNTAPAQPAASAAGRRTRDCEDCALPRQTAARHPHAHTLARKGMEPGHGDSWAMPAALSVAGALVLWGATRARLRRGSADMSLLARIARRDHAAAEAGKLLPIATKPHIVLDGGIPVRPSGSVPPAAFCAARLAIAAACNCLGHSQRTPPST